MTIPAATLGALALVIPGVAAAATTKPVVTDLDIDLRQGTTTFVVTVEARNANTVKVTYNGITKTARLDPDDANERDKDYVARFTARREHRVNNKRVSVRATATRGAAKTVVTLTDRVDIDSD